MSDKSSEDEQGTCRKANKLRNFGGAASRMSKFYFYNDQIYNKRKFEQGFIQYALMRTENDLFEHGEYVKKENSTGSLGVSLHLKVNAD